MHVLRPVSSAHSSRFIDPIVMIHLKLRAFPDVPTAMVHIGPDQVSILSILINRPM